ncbi:MULTISPECIES: hypothetical protein [unclassified Streptomyces]|nr:MULTISPECIES: hypothetical protein [unclassified Streptomyces]MCX5054942.1 hypothetical protein [Streptomyces sp. NBC_00474]
MPYMGVRAEGSCGSVTYEDVVARVAVGRRVGRRKAVPRRVLLGGLGRES